MSDEAMRQAFQGKAQKGKNRATKAARVLRDELRYCLRWLMLS